MCDGLILAVLCPPGETLPVGGSTQGGAYVMCDDLVSCRLVRFVVDTACNTSFPTARGCDGYATAVYIYIIYMQEGKPRQKTRSWQAS